MNPCLQGVNVPSILIHVNVSFTGLQKISETFKAKNIFTKSKSSVQKSSNNWIALGQHNGAASRAGASLLQRPGFDPYL